MKKLKTIPKFKSEAEEFEFWSTHDSTEYVDFDKLEPVHFPNLKPSEYSNLFSLDPAIAKKIHRLAKEKEIPSSKLLEQFAKQGLKSSVHRRRASA
jgi:hypothetical protein